MFNYRLQAVSKRNKLTYRFKHLGTFVRVKKGKITSFPLKQKRTTNCFPILG